MIERAEIKLVDVRGLESLTPCLQRRPGQNTADRLVAVIGPGTVGAGLRGMRERVKAFGGELEILSDSQGTVVRAVIPLSPSASAGDE